MNCIAHRGFAGVNPENTLPAIREAAGGADGIEVDVRRCGSGELVLHHDETVDRVTDGTGPVSALTAAELDALYVRGTDAGVPTLEAALSAVPETVTLHVELKERGLGADLESLVAAADGPRDVVVSSFDPAALDGAERLPRALLVRDGENAIDRARGLDCAGIHPSVGACTPPLVRAAHDAALTVNAWTVTEPVETDRLRAMGVDGVITDFPACCPSNVADRSLRDDGS